MQCILHTLPYSKGFEARDNAKHAGEGEDNSMRKWIIVIDLSTHASNVREMWHQWHWTRLECYKHVASEFVSKAEKKKCPRKKEKGEKKEKKPCDPSSLFQHANDSVSGFK